MKKILLFLAPIVLFINCTSYNFGTKKFYPFYDGKYSIEKAPPGTLKISQNKFVDINEIPNIGYKEFKSWVKRIYGDDSPLYNLIKLDTTAWINDEEFGNSAQEYLNHPKYNDYPVVGINLEQAKIYTKWRTDRVAEMILVSEGKIQFDAFPSLENHFTVEKYLNNEYYKTIIYEDIFVPVYDIPNADEWESFAIGDSDFRFGTNENNKSNKKILKKTGFLYCTKEYALSRMKKQDRTPTAARSVLSRNIYGLTGIVGNVSEIVDEEGISKGGSWKDSISEIDLRKANEFHSPNSWTGFRNVSEWKKLKINKPESMR